MYGNVGGYLVLFTAWHCRPNSSYAGKIVYGPNGSMIGYWNYGGNSSYAGDICYGADCAYQHDLNYIVLYQGNWPSTLNRIYRGSAPSPVYWTITDGTQEALSCAGMDSSINDTIYQMFQPTATNGWTYRTGYLNGFETWTDSTHCTVWTTLHWQGGGTPSYRDSGTPFIDPWDANTIFGLASAAPRPSNNLVVTPIYEGIKVLYRHFHYDLGSTAYFCKSADCSS